MLFLRDTTTMNDHSWWLCEFMFVAFKLFHFNTRRSIYQGYGVFPENETINILRLLKGSC